MQPETVEPSDWDLLSKHSGAFSRLKRALTGRASFTLCFLTFSDSAYRDHAAQFFRGSLRAEAPVVVDPDARIGTEELFLRLGAGDATAPAQLVGIEHWPEGLDDLLARLNHRREALAERCARPLLFWVPSLLTATVATRAADLWAWRSGVFDFTLPEEPRLPRLAHGHVDENRVSASVREARIAELRDYLHSRPRWEAVDVDLAIELGDLLDVSGATTQADETYRKAEAALRHLGDPRRTAIAWGRIANMLQTRGRLDEALRVRFDREIPVFEAIGDSRKLAIALGQVAEIRATQGHLDEALRIHREEELPAYRRLNEPQLYANAQGRVADVLKLRGDFDESLRVRYEEQLPVYREYENNRQYAITLGHVADILALRGELDEALRIRREELLPAYEGLGDHREYAITQVQIADVLATRGDFDAALDLLEKQLPVFKRLGDDRETAIAESQIADILANRGQLAAALNIVRGHPRVFEDLGDVRSRAVAQGQIASILARQGDLAEALRLRETEELPVYERLGDAAAMEVARSRIAELRGGKLG